MSVIALRGRIGEGEALSFEKTKVLIEEAFDKSNLVAVAMLINSGGGSPLQSQLIASYLLAKSKSTGVPIFAFAEDTAGSF